MCNDTTATCDVSLTAQGKVWMIHWLTKFITSRQKSPDIKFDFLGGLWLHKFIFSLTHQHLHSSTLQSLNPATKGEFVGSATTNKHTPHHLFCLFREREFRLIAYLCQSLISAKSPALTKQRQVLILQIATHSRAPIQWNTTS